MASIEPGVLLKTGDKVYLMKTAGITGNATLVNSSHVQQGYSLQYDLTLVQDPTDVYATINAIDLNPQTKSFVEGRLAGLALLNQGADMVADQGMSSAMAAVDQLEGRTTLFGTVAGSSNRYDTGSKIDLDGFGVMVGAARREGQAAGAAFIETGWGNYDSYNTFNNAPSVHGDGNTKYYGVGVLGRYDFKNGLYLDGSARIGKTKTDFTGKNFYNTDGERAHYNSKVTYVSAHAGLGYILPVNELTKLDLSAKYLWTRQGSDSVNIGGDPINFDSENSHRTRLMAKVLRQVTPQLNISGALGYEYEFDGKARATAYRIYQIDEPSLKGGTGIGEIGLEYKPQTNQRLSLEAKLTGYVGQRDGIGGLFRMNYRF